MRRPYPAVGVTGGVGCGKSEIGRILREAGAAVLDADDQVHDLLNSDPGVRDAVRRVLGAEMAGPDGALDRAAIARAVFADVTKRRALEAILHPPVWARIREWRDARRERGGSAALIPLLFEAGLTEGWTETWCVVAPDATADARLRARGWDAAEIARRRAAQWPPAEKSARADCIIVNDGTIGELRDRVMARWNELMERSS